MHIRYPIAGLETCKPCADGAKDNTHPRQQWLAGVQSEYPKMSSVLISVTSLLCCAGRPRGVSCCFCRRLLSSDGLLNVTIRGLLGGALGGLSAMQVLGTGQKFCQGSQPRAFVVYWLCLSVVCNGLQCDVRMSLPASTEHTWVYLPNSVQKRSCAQLHL